MVRLDDYFTNAENCRKLTRQQRARTNEPAEAQHQIHPDPRMNIQRTHQIQTVEDAEIDCGQIHGHACSAKIQLEYCQPGNGAHRNGGAAEINVTVVSNDSGYGQSHPYERLDLRRT